MFTLGSSPFAHGWQPYGRAPSRSGRSDSMASDDDDDDGVRAQPDQVGVEAAPATAPDATQARSDNG